MGACDFSVTVKGPNAKAAFAAACKEARYECGHGGYTGTIAEKDSFVLIPRDRSMPPQDQAKQMLDADDPRIVDKWGPAGCFDLGNGEWLFFGFASC